MITEIRKGTGFKMSEEDILFQKRLEELANKSYTNSQYIFTGFLSLAEQDLYHRIERDISYVPATFYGGTTDCVYLAVTSMWTYEEAPDQGY